MPDEASDVRPHPLLLEHVEVLRKGLESPVDALAQRFERHAFHVREVAHDQVAIGGPARCDRETAIAHDDRRDAQRGRRIGERVPGDLGVVVGMGIDDARHEREAGRVYAFACAITNVADRGNAPLAYGYAGLLRCGAGPVVQGGVVDD